ncbi:spsA [Anditalea andensis]|uniref:SpsA n=2 Tax=Anditalea andensis TaxID=1048983 RepID=A0A074LFN4_9BACT|nr:spsA [Anditalea andensis]
MSELSVMILTYNEEIHLGRCLENVKLLTDKIFIVDSFSTDGTQKIAEEFGANFYQNKWENSHAKQLNWALENLPLETPWILRVDADEYLTPELIQEIAQKLPTIDENVSGITLPLRRIFLGRHIKKGGTARIKLLRLFRKGKVISEQRWMDEHMQVLSGEIIDFENEFADDNLNHIIWWSAKHNGYAVREAIELLDLEYEFLEKRDQHHFQLNEEASAKRTRKLSYAKKPLFIRAFAYFIYRYIFKLGFTEGKEGFLWHFLQGWWYRTLVDTIIFEVKKTCGNNPEEIKSYFSKKYNIRF